MLIKKEDEGEERGQTAFLADPYAKSAEQPKEGKLLLNGQHNLAINNNTNPGEISEQWNAAQSQIYVTLSLSSFLSLSLSGANTYGLWLGVRIPARRN